MVKAVPVEEANRLGLFYVSSYQFRYCRKDVNAQREPSYAKLLHSIQHSPESIK